MKDARDTIIYFALIHNGDWQKIYHSIRKGEDINWDIYDKFPEQLKKNCITIIDTEIYPRALANVYHPPFVLFYRGDINLLKETRRVVGVVGPRYPTDYGIEATKMIIDSIKDDYIIASGMAIGIDNVTHRYVIENKGRTIGVIPCGINDCYPPSSRDIYDEMSKNHLVISEYPFRYELTPEKFPYRNRIVVGISKALIIPEVRDKSGTLSSIHLALWFGRDILVVPHPFNDDTMNNQLINEGADMVCSKEDIDDILNK